MITTAFDAHHAAMEAAMDQYIDDLSGGAARTGPVLPPDGQHQPMPDPAMMLQQMMQHMMQQINMMFAQNAPGGQNAGTSSAAFSLQGAANWQGPPSQQSTGNWQEDRSTANVRLDERASRRIEKFTDKKDEWTEWRDQVLNVVRECDK